jgi:hypothetical protein
LYAVLDEYNVLKIGSGGRNQGEGCKLKKGIQKAMIFIDKDWHRSQ